MAFDGLFRKAELGGDGALTQVVETVEQEGLAAGFRQMLERGPDMPQALAGFGMVCGIGTEIGGFVEQIGAGDMVAVAHQVMVIRIGGEVGSGAVEPGARVVGSAGFAGSEQACETFLNDIFGVGSAAPDTQVAAQLCGVTAEQFGESVRFFQRLAHASVTAHVARAHRVAIFSCAERMSWTIPPSSFRLSPG